MEVEQSVGWLLVEDDGLSHFADVEFLIVGPPIIWVFAPANGDGVGVGVEPFVFRVFEGHFQVLYRRDRIK